MTARPALVALALWLGQAGAWACSACNQPTAAQTTNFYPLATLLMLGMASLIVGGCAYFLYSIERAPDGPAEAAPQPLPGEGAVT